MFIQKALFAFFIYCAFSASWAIENENTYSADFQNTSAKNSRDQILEFWGYHDYQGNQSYSDTIKLRYYHPLDIERFQGTIRLDTSYVSSSGPSFPGQSSSQYSLGTTMLTFWGSHPDLLPNSGANFGGRIIFPFGNNSQWAIGPQIGANFRPSEKNTLSLADFSPLARYMYGFDAKNNSTQGGSTQTPLVRNLQLYPTLGFQLAPDTQLRLWDENGAIYNSAGGGWFVPIDAMVAHRVSKNFLFAIGASKQIVQTYNQYDWSIYGKVSFNF